MQASNFNNMQDEIDIEMLKAYLNQSRVGIYCAYPLALFLAVSYYHISPAGNILIWIGTASLIYAYSIYTFNQFKPTTPIYNIGFFKKRQHFLNVLYGIIWGSSYYFLLDVAHPKFTDFRLVASVSAVIAFAASAISVSMPGLIGFLIASFVISSAFFMSNLEVYWWWLVGSCGLTASCLFFGWKASQYISSQVEGRLLNMAYIDELRGLNEKIEANNRDFIKRNVELQYMQKQLEKLATQDELTGLFNRRFILERIEEKLPEVRRHRLNYCLVLLDIDYFKNVNDRFGHAAGDEVLRGTAEILLRELRQGDVVARYGGEEFLIVLPMTELSSAQGLVERLRQVIEHQKYTFEATRLSVTASFGITQYVPDDTADKMIDRADQALYQAKLAGRNCIQVAT